jgi:carbon storage regulator
MRRVGESIYIGGKVVVTLVSLDRNRARIGIVAPTDIPVHREEVYERIKRELQGDADGNIVKDEPVSKS